MPSSEDKETIIDIKPLHVLLLGAGVLGSGQYTCDNTRHGNSTRVHTISAPTTVGGKLRCCKLLNCISPAGVLLTASVSYKQAGKQ